MLEERLEKYFQRIDEKLNNVLNSDLKSSIAKFIFDIDKFKDPYKFAHQNNLDVETTLKLFLFFTDGNLPPLDIFMYVDCQNLECKSPIYLEGAHLEDHITCLHCSEQFSKEDIQRIVKVKFKKNEDFFMTKPPSCTFDILTRSDDGLKSYPAILQNQPIVFDEMKSNMAGVPLNTLTTLNTTSNEETISKPLSTLEERFYQNMSSFKIV